MDDIVESLNDVGLKDRSMVWNTDLVEVRASSYYNEHPEHCCTRVQISEAHLVSPSRCAYLLLVHQGGMHEGMELLGAYGQPRQFCRLIVQSDQG